MRRNKRGPHNTAPVEMNPVDALTPYCAVIPGVGHAIVMVQPAALSIQDADDNVLHHDLIELLMVKHGARQATVPFTRDPVTPAWDARYMLGRQQDLLISVPGAKLFEGSMPLGAGWDDIVKAGGGPVIVFTGRLPAVDLFEDAVARGHMRQVTMHMTITRR